MAVSTPKLKNCRLLNVAKPSSDRTRYSYLPMEKEPLSDNFNPQSTVVIQMDDPLYGRAQWEGTLVEVTGSYAYAKVQATDTSKFKPPVEDGKPQKAIANVSVTITVTEPASAGGGSSPATPIKVDLYNE